MKAVPVTTLDELVESGTVQLTRGKIISKRDIAACPGNFPIYSSAKDNDGKFGEYGKFLFDEELITWSVDGGGRLFHRPKHKFSVTNVGGVLRIRDTSILDYRYLYFVLTLRHSEISFDWVRKAHPSVIKKLYQNIPLPPLAEQQRIVGLLDEAFEGLATAKTNAEKNLQNARALFESHLQSVFTQRGPGWVEKKISDLSDYITVGFVGTMAHLFVDEGIPLLRGQNIRAHGIDFTNLKFISKETHAKWKKSALRPGDVAIVRVGYPGTAAVVPEGSPELNAASLVIVRPNQQRLDSYFLAHALNSEWGKSAIKARLVGAAQQVFNTGTAADLQIPLPPLAEQKVLVEHFDSLREETHHLARLYERKHAALEALKKSLLHQAFNGAL